MVRSLFVFCCVSFTRKFSEMCWIAIQGYIYPDIYPFWGYMIGFHILFQIRIYDRIYIHFLKNWTYPISTIFNSIFNKFRLNFSSLIYEVNLIFCSWLWFVNHSRRKTEDTTAQGYILRGKLWNHLDFIGYRIGYMILYPDIISFSRIWDRIWDRIDILFKFWI